MVQNNKFHGLPNEDPLDHLDEFKRLCGLTKISGVSEDALKLRLFPFSLGDRARVWEKQLAPASIGTWADCKKAFLGKFFSNARTAKLRNAISGFTQKSTETFSEAWERFKTYQSQCPHHGFTEESLLSTLYRGVVPKIRMLLDTASNGNFLNKEVEDGWDLVENLAQADGQYCEDYDRSNRGQGESDSVIRKELKALHDKMERLLAQKQVHSVADDSLVEDEESEMVEEISYLQNQGAYKYNNYRQNPNLSYRSNNVANPEDQVYPQQQQRPFVPKKPFVPYGQQQAPPPGFQPQKQQQEAPQQSNDMMNMLQQLLQGQATTNKEISNMKSELNSRIDASHNDLKCKFETLNSRVKYLEGMQQGQQSKQTGQLPGKSVQNPKEYTASAITLRSGRELQSPVRNAVIAEDSIVEEEEDDRLRNEENVADNEQIKKPENDEKTAVENKAAATEKSKQFVPPPYKPQLPFPGRFKKELVEKYKALFEKQMKDIELKIPLLDAFMLVPPYQKFLKDAVKERTKEVEGMVVLTHECSAIIQRSRLPKKLEDPGTFTIPCSVGPQVFESCLCDLGASISLMPLSVAKRLGFEKYKPCRISLVLADHSVRTPHGILEDLPVRVGNVEIPTDFVVLEMDDEPKDPLLFGRPFLATAGAIIDVKNGTIELNLGKDFKMKFDIKDIMKKPKIEGQLFWVQEIDALSDELLEEITEEDHLQTALTKGSEQGYLHRETECYEKLLDSHRVVKDSDCFEELRRNENVSAVSMVD